MKRSMLGALLALSMASAVPAAPIASIDLAKPMRTLSPWRFGASQGADVADPVMDGKIPGPVTLCLSKDGGQSCGTALYAMLGSVDPNDIFGIPHALRDARVVRPRADRPLLLVQVASLQSANGNQRIATRLLAYDRARDDFAPVYDLVTGRNNNQEVRYIAQGPLGGAVISAEPTDNAPFGYWITVSRIGAARPYHRVLHYRSATHYGDGNPLAVIDSEMPAILGRLGLWRAGQPLPLPAGPCPRPHMDRGSLRCK